MVVDQLRILFHFLHLPENTVQSLVQLLLTAKHRPHALHQTVEFFLKGQQLPQPFFKNIGKVEKPQGVASGSSIENYHLEIHLFNRA